MAFLDQKEKRLGFGIVNGESEILASDWPSQFDFDQWPQLYGLQPTLFVKTWLNQTQYYYANPALQIFVHLNVRHCPRTISFLKIQHMLGISVTVTKAVFVYLCFCVFVFACQTNGSFVFEVLVPLPFQKYSICQTYLQL